MAALNQAFADKFRSSSRTRFRDEYRVDLRKDGFTGDMNTGPVISDIHIDYGARRLETGLIPSAARITFLDRNHLYGTELALSEPRDWQIRIYKGTDLEWEGYVLPENLDENLSEIDEYLTIEATDGTTYLHDYIYDGATEGRVSIAKLIYDAFAQISSQSTVRINNLLTPYAATPLAGNETLSGQYVDVSLLVGKTWYQVLVDDILKRFGLAACYMDGSFAVFDIHSLDNASYSLDHIDSDGAKTGSPATANRIEQSTYRIGNRAKLQGAKAAQRVSVHWDRGYASDLLTYTPNLAVADGWFASPGRSGDDTDPFPTVAGTLRFEDNGLPALSGLAFQEGQFTTGADVFGIRFAGLVRHTADDPTVVSSLTNGMSAWGLSHTTSGGDRLWYNHTTEEWQEAQVRNNIVASFPTGQAFDFTIPDPGDSGTLRLNLFGGTATVTTDRQTAIYLEWIGVNLQSIVAEAGQRLLYTTFAQNTDAKAGELLDVPGENDDFTYGSLFIEDENKYPSSITLDAAGEEQARGYKIGRYNAGETPDYTNAILTLDGELARHQLMLRSDHVKILRTELLLSEATVLAPGRGIVYDGETYMAREIINNLKDRTARIIAVRVKPEEPDNVSIEVLKIAEDVRNRNRLERRKANAQLLPSRGTGIVTRQGTGDDTGDDPGTYDVVQYGTDGQVFSVVDGVPAWTDPGGLPEYGVAQAGRVLKINSMGQTVWGVDEVGATGNTVPDFDTDNNGQVLGVVNGALDFVEDQDTTYAAGTGLHLDTDTDTFSVLRPLPSTTTDDVGKILKVNSDGNGYILGTDANTTYATGSGITLEAVAENPDKFKIDLANNSGLEFSDNTDAGKLRVDVGNGLQRHSSGVRVRAHTGITVSSNGVAVTRPLSAADRTLLDSGVEAGATIDQTGPEIVALLTALTGTDRLDASAIKGLTDNNDNDFVTAGTYASGSLTLTVSNQDNVVVTGFPTGFAASAITGLSTVATTGSYNDLDDTPTIPTNTNDFVTAGTYASGTLTLTVSNQDDVTVTGFPTSFDVAFSDITGEIAITQIPSTIARTADIPAATTSLPFSSITGTIADSQIPAGIARDTELPTAGTGITANGTAFNIDVAVPAFSSASGGQVLKVVDTDGTLSLGWGDDEVGEPGTGEANVQSDWNVSSDTSDAYIKNKPTEAIARIPSAPTEADHRKVWMAIDADTDNTGSAVDGAWTQIAYTDISGTPTIPAATTTLPFTAITGMIADGQIPSTITRDTELPTAGTGITADGTTWNLDVPVPSFASASGGDVLQVVDTDGTLSLGWDALSIPDALPTYGEGDHLKVLEVFDTDTETANSEVEVRWARLQAVARSGSYNDLLHRPSIPDALPSFVEADARKMLMLNDADPDNTGDTLTVGWGFHSYNDLADIPTFASVATSGSYNDLLNKPIPDYDEDDHQKVLTVIDSDPDTPLTSFALQWDTLHPVARTGEYSALNNLPSIPASFADLTGMVADAQIPSTIARVDDIPTSIADLATRSYNDLTDTPDPITGVSPISVTSGAIKLLGIDEDFTVATTENGSELETGILVRQRTHTGTGSGYTWKLLEVPASDRFLKTIRRDVSGGVQNRLEWVQAPFESVTSIVGAKGIKITDLNNRPAQSGNLAMNLDVNESQFQFTGSGLNRKLALADDQELPDYSAATAGQVLQVNVTDGVRSLGFATVTGGGGGGGTGSGDIESVIAGDGLTGGATSGNATLSLLLNPSGSGLTSNANGLALDNPLPGFASATDGQVLTVHVATDMTKSIRWENPAAGTGGGGGTADAVAWDDVTGKPEALSYLDITSSIQAQLDALRAEIATKQNLLSSLTGAAKVAARQNLGIRTLEDQDAYDAITPDANDLYNIKED